MCHLPGMEQVARETKTIVKSLRTKSWNIHNMFGVSLCDIVHWCVGVGIGQVFGDTSANMVLTCPNIDNSFEINLRTHNGSYLGPTCTDHHGVFVSHGWPVCQVLGDSCANMSLTIPELDSGTIAVTINAKHSLQILPGI